MITDKKTLAVVIGAILSSVVAGNVTAQASEVNAGELSIIEEIVVTATKRETNLQETALSINVLTGEELAARGITSVNEFINTVPGVSVTGSAPGQSDFNVRGITTSNASVGRATTVAYMDEFPLATALVNRDIRLIDIDRVEILKGPQGTLYGQSAMGGIVRYITNKPDTGSIFGNITSYVSNTEDSDGINYGVNGYINVPVTDNLALRITGYQYDNDGFVDVKGGFPRDDANTEDTAGGRFALRWDISDRTTLDFTYLNQRVDAGVPRVSETFDLAPGSVDIQPVDLADPIDQSFIHWVYKDEIFNLKLDVNFDAFTLSVMAAGNEADDRKTDDQGGYAGLTNSFAMQTYSDESENTTFEVRLVSDNDGDDFIDWIAGVWYGDFERTSGADTRHVGPDAFGGAVTEGSIYQDVETLNTNEELAFYGEVSMHFSEQTTLTLGYRQSDVEVDQDVLKANGLFDGGSRPLIGVDQFTQEDVNTYKINLEHRLKEDILLYGLASSGYRAGGFNPANLSADVLASSYESDSLWNYEVGAKTAWLDNRLIANATVYRVDWKDIQLRRGVLGSTGVVYITDNAGEGQIDGIEMEMEYRTTDYLTLGLNLSYLNGEIINVAEQVVNASGAAVSKGDRLPGSAEKTYALYIDYRRPVFDNMDLSVRLTHRYIGDRLTALGAGGTVQSNRTIPSYDTTDLRIGLSHNNGIQTSMFVNNISNNISYTWIETMPQYTRYYITQPRTIGLNIGYTY